MLIERADPRADDIRPFFDLCTAAQKIDDPYGPPTSYTDFRGRLVWGSSAEPRQTWLSWADDRSRLLGGYTIMLPTYDNVHTAIVEVVVHPQLRRRGYGHALVEHASARTREDGRRLLIGDAADGSPGLAFCDALGAARATVELRSVQDLSGLGEPRLNELLGEARAAADGYSLLSWTGVVPDEHLDSFAALRCAMSDAPVDRLEWSPEVWDAGRVRADEKRMIDTRARAYTLVARHDDSGQLVGLTRVFVSEEHHGWAQQGDTVVVPNHRGHRLGLLMKVSMLPWLREREPDVRRIVTGNAESNGYMLHVNRLLGYRLLDRWIGCQLPL